MAKAFTGFQWLLIDVATQYGMDKCQFEERLEWATENIDKLWDLGLEKKAYHDSLEDKYSDVWKEYPLYMKAVLAVKDAREGKPIGHRVGVDAASSGAQIMSAVMGCYSGVKATGLVDTDRRADLYGQLTGAMNEILGNGLATKRKDAKKAYMTSLYGSKKTPKDIFGEGSEALAAFYECVQTITPGAWQLLQALLNAWNPNTSRHKWVMPDGYECNVRVETDKSVRIEVDELQKSSFTYLYTEYGPSEYGISLPANVTHSLDAYVLRNMHRRCNYDEGKVINAVYWLKAELDARDYRQVIKAKGKMKEVLENYERSTLVDIYMIDLINKDTVMMLPTEFIEKLLSILEDMLKHKPFPIVTIHDDFQSHPNYVDWVRYHYKNILADLADSEVISDILSQLYEEPVYLEKLSEGLGEIIRQSEYGLC